MDKFPAFDTNVYVVNALILSERNKIEEFASDRSCVRLSLSIVELDWLSSLNNESRYSSIADNCVLKVVSFPPFISPSVVMVVFSKYNLPVELILISEMVQSKDRLTLIWLFFIVKSPSIRISPSIHKLSPSKTTVSSLEIVKLVYSNFSDKASPVKKIIESTKSALRMVKIRIIILKDGPYKSNLLSFFGMILVLKGDLRDRNNETTLGIIIDCCLIFATDSRR